MTGLGSRLIRQGFGCPHGWPGRLGGALMAHGNAATERHVVRLAALDAHDVVLVVGPGPGIGVQAAAAHAGHVIAVDPSPLMLGACRRRCARFVEQGRVELVVGDAEHTGRSDQSVDVAIAVTSVQIWPDLPAGLAELHRVLRPGGRLLLSAHQKWLTGGLGALAAAVAESGFTHVRTWTWEPPGRGATTAAQLHAIRKRAPTDAE